MSETPTMLDVTILGREYRVACKEAEREELLKAVQFLDQRMREIRDAGKIAGTERIAVMAALNIAHELLGTKGGDASASDAKSFDTAGVQRRISAMQSAIDRAMADQDI